MNWNIKPDKDLLEKLVWDYSLVELSLFFETSNKTIEKKCKELNVELPPKGYWHTGARRDSKIKRLESLFSLKEKIQSPQETSK